MSTSEVLDAYSLIRQEIGHVRVREFKAFEFGPKQVMILYRLSKSSASMSELAEFTLSDKASTSRTIDALEEMGVVKRARRKGDRRVTVIELTPKGKSKAAKTVQLREHISEQVNKTLTTNERKALAVLLTKVAKRLYSARRKK